MLRKLLFATATAAVLAASPAAAGPWRNYANYYPIPNPGAIYVLPYGLPVAAYPAVTVAVPVVTYVPMTVRVYGITPQPPYYNVPPYTVLTPY
jgi:hypothetical protein